MGGFFTPANKAVRLRVRVRWFHGRQPVCAMKIQRVSELNASAAAFSKAGRKGLNCVARNFNLRKAAYKFAFATNRYRLSVCPWIYGKIRTIRLNVSSS